MAKDTLVLPKRKVAHIAYQLEEFGGGYQLYRLNLDEDRKMTSRERIGWPDAWDQTILLMEAELSKQFQ